MGRRGATRVGALPTGVNNVRGLASDGTNLYGIQASSLYLIDPTDPYSTSGNFGLIGDYSSGLTSAGSATWHNGNRYVAAAGQGDSLWIIDRPTPTAPLATLGAWAACQRA